MLDRVRQVREASLGPDAHDLELARDCLTSDLLALFTAQEPRDQRHAAGTARWLIERGHDRDHDLLVAALVHDVGKGSQRTRDRVAHVVTGWVRVGAGVAAPASRFEMRRAIARSRAHSEHGADLLVAAGASPRVVELTRLHHRSAGQDAMLALLQRADAAT